MQQGQGMYDHLNVQIAHIASAGAILGALGGWLPPAAAFIGMVWYCIQIFETKTVQDWIKRRRTRKVVEEAVAEALVENKVVEQVVEKVINPGEPQPPEK